MAFLSSTPDQKLAALRRLPIFAGAGHRQLQRLGRLVELQSVPAGTVVQRQGERVRHWLYVVEGALVRSRHGRPAGLVAAGTSWGAPLLAGRQPSPESLEALEQAQLLWLEARSWADVAEEFLAMGDVWALAPAAVGDEATGPAESADPVELSRP